MRPPLLRVLLAVSACWIGCSSERNGPGQAPEQTFPQQDGGASAGCSGLSCSRDLRSVRDCSDKVVKECGADQACGNGECLSPCDAAAANEGSLGCSFAVPGPNSQLNAFGSCLAFFVANNWTTPATLRLSFKGEEKSLDGAVFVPSVEDGVVKHTKLEGPLPPGGAAVIFVSEEDTGADRRIPCPSSVKAVFDEEASINVTGIGSNATFVTADVPISMYSMYPYGGARSYFPSAMLLFPTTSFRKNYVLVSAWGGKSDGFGRGLLPGRSDYTEQAGAPTLQIVAIHDDTSIDFLPKVDIVGGGGVAPAPRDEVTSYKLRRGDVLQITQDNELVGSVIETSKPVGVFGGSTQMFIPSDCGYADNENNQIPPVSAWGSEYAVLPAPKRTEIVTQGRERERDPSIVRLVGAANGTTLTYEPLQPAGAPNTLEAGQLAVFFTEEPLVVRSQDRAHPYYAAVVMTGGANTTSGMGDPEVAMVTPTNQWLDTYGFFSDYSYRSSLAYVTRRKVDGAFRDVTLDCAGVIEGWKPISGDFEWSLVELTRDAQPQQYPAGRCTDGAHRIRSDGPFAVTIWGLSPYASYAYPGGTGLRPFSEFHVPVR